MRILLVNKFYYPRGGDCTVTLSTEALLRAKGHEVAVYAMQYPENIESQWSQYFPSEVSFGGGISSKMAAGARLFGDQAVKKSFEKILRDFCPDVVHLHNIHSYISPIVAQMAKQREIRVVWTLHDYKLLCPAYSCLRQNATCELCYHDKSQVVRTRCMKGSLVASLLAYTEAKYWSRDRLQILVDRFICPSAFMASKMRSGGFDSSRLAVLNNFIDTTSLTASLPDRDNYYCYVGRLSTEKGVQTLIEAAQLLPYTLKIVGGGPLADELRALARDVRTIEFLGHQPFERVKDILSKAKFSIMPSEWYENNPLSVIESLSMGTPVLGANMGGIPELIDTDSNGLIFEAKSVGDLQDRIEQMMAREFDYTAIAQRARDRFSADTHYQKLMAIYKD